MLPGAVDHISMVLPLTGSSVSGEVFQSSGKACHVVVSRWKFPKNASGSAIGAFVQSLESTFQTATRSLIETPLHSQYVGGVPGGYIEMSSGYTEIGLWVSVQNSNTIYTVSFSSNRDAFNGVKATYFESFKLMN